MANPYAVDAAERSSIDLSLELEHQLQLEDDASHPSSSRPHSLDPHVLSALIKSLHAEVSKLTKERDELAGALGDSREREGDLREEVHRMMETHATMDEQMDELRHKNQEAEESIALLRSKVEDSRRALMRLQTENRRGPGNMSIDLSRTSNFTFGGGPTSSKRMSFTPVAGSPAAHPGHRRLASNFSAAGGDQDGASVLSIPTGPSDVFGMGMASPRSPLMRHESDPALQKQIDTLKQQLEETRAELSEAVEARESSDMLAKTLRAFIDEYNVGQATPPPPEMPRRLSSETKPPPARWGFGLWRSPDPSKDTTPAQGHVPSASVSAPSPPTAVEPLTKKLGGFFSGTRRMSQASVSTSMSPPMPHREPPSLDAEYSSSTTSSVDTPEPTSPIDALQRTISIDGTPGAKSTSLSETPGGVQIVPA
ncbi:hypothetical protein PENSPDRAFT_659411 [Peniophora sp. CONT]|nr:hypothetical protein PENSPDRAFT_659411 [Peniophora sp. CONT]